MAHDRRSRTAGPRTRTRTSVRLPRSPALCTRPSAPASIRTRTGSPATRCGARTARTPTRGFRTPTLAISRCRRSPSCGTSRTTTIRVVATVSYEGWHLGMIGHGAQREGGDKDIAVAVGADERDEWWINEDFYELPPTSARPTWRPSKATRTSSTNATAWRTARGSGTPSKRSGSTTRPIAPATRPALRHSFASPATRSSMSCETRTSARTTSPTSFWIEMKMPDYAGHAWNMTRPRGGGRPARDRRADRPASRASSTRRSGRGNYIFAISADHGQQPLPGPVTEAGGSTRRSSSATSKRASANIVEKVTPVDVYFDLDAIEEEEIDLDDVARFLGTYTLGDNIPDGAAGRRPRARRPTRRVLFAGGLLDRLPRRL